MVYNLIDRGLIDIRNIDLPMKLRLQSCRKKTSEPYGQNKRVLRRSIDDRDPSVLICESFGHWELDLVLGKKTKGEPVILTFIERHTHYLITKKLWNKSPQYIKQAMIKIIAEYGPKNFETIKTDNGYNFAELKEIKNTYDHIKVYYTREYVSWEKGSNERHNGMIREFIPIKAGLWDTLTYKRLKMCTQAINNRPRRLLDYQTPQELFNKIIVIQRMKHPNIATLDDATMVKNPFTDRHLNGTIGACNILWLVSSKFSFFYPRTNPTNEIPGRVTNVKGTPQGSGYF